MTFLALVGITFIVSFVLVTIGFFIFYWCGLFGPYGLAPKWWIKKNWKEDDHIS